MVENYDFGIVRVEHGQIKVRIDIGDEYGCEICKKEIPAIKNLLKKNDKLYGGSMAINGGKHGLYIKLIPDFNASGNVTHFHIEVQDHVGIIK